MDDLALLGMINSGRVERSEHWKQRRASAERRFNDELWDHEWYLVSSSRWVWTERNVLAE
jgi:hypothetical protein